MRTYNDVYLSVRKKLKAAGIDAFSLEARLLCSSAAGKTKEAFIRDLKYYAADDYTDKVRSLVDRRIGGEPMAYIVGEWEFYGLPFKITPDVLIPRVDTELLVDKAIEFLNGRYESCRVLDLCTGSGCVGIAVAANVPDSRVILIDKYRKALDVCHANIIINSVPHSTNCLEADVLKSPPILMGSFDLILCNPPYIPTGDIASLDPSVKDHEPITALNGGSDGLDFYRAVTEKWSVLLKKNGVLMFECGIGQAEDVMNIMGQFGFTELKAYKDTLQIDRVVAGKLM